MTAPCQLDQEFLSRGDFPTLFLQDLQNDLLAMARGRSIEQIANCLNGVTLLANHKADVALLELDLEDHLPWRLDFRQNHLIGKFDETADNEFDEFFHG